MLLMHSAPFDSDGKIAGAMAMAGLAVAATQHGSPSDAFGIMDGFPAMSAPAPAKPAIPDYSRIALACAASARPALNKLGDAMRKASA